MVSEETIREEQLTTEEVLDRELETPQQECEWVPEWDEYPEEQPGENTRLKDGVLYWERDGFTVKLESYETTHWKATVEIPEEVGKWSPRAIDLKCNPKPEYGFVESVDAENHEATEAVLILQDNFQPVFEVQQWIDAQIESAEHGEQFQDELGSKTSLARENEERLKAEREPGWDAGEEQLICPHCKESSSHVHMDGNTPTCIHCEGDLSNYVEGENWS